MPQIGRVWVGSCLVDLPKRRGRPGDSLRLWWYLVAFPLSLSARYWAGLPGVGSASGSVSGCSVDRLALVSGLGSGWLGLWLALSGCLVA